MNVAKQVPLVVAHNKPLAVTSKHFHDHKFEIYAYLREHLPVHLASIMGMKVFVTARYADCLEVVKSERFRRNRATVTGGRRSPIPLPKRVQLLANSMITEDDPEHRRLRNIVQKAFAPKKVQAMSGHIEALAHGLLDDCAEDAPVNIQQDYALAIPVAVIAQMMGVDEEDMGRLRNSIRVLSAGLSGWAMLRTMAWDMPKAIDFMHTLINKKRQQPGDDILSALIEAEEEGDRLSQDELVAMIFLLIIAGYETTVHLVSNGIATLVQHPEQLQLVLDEPTLWGSAVEEILRYSGPIHGTKMNYASEDMEMRGVAIAKGSPVVPLLGSANRDAEVFADPDVFDVRRDPNKHLAFSQGNHFCLGAFLARMEAKLAFKVLFERYPDLRLAVPAEQLGFQRMPFWNRYEELPVLLKG